VVDEINAALQAAGSKFRTEDGLNLVMFLRAGRDGIVFLRRSFDSPKQCLAFVREAIGKEISV